MKKRKGTSKRKATPRKVIGIDKPLLSKKLRTSLPYRLLMITFVILIVLVLSLVFIKLVQKFYGEDVFDGDGELGTLGIGEGDIGVFAIEEDYGGPIGLKEFIFRLPRRAVIPYRRSIGFFVNSDQA